MKNFVCLLALLLFVQCSNSDMETTFINLDNQDDEVMSLASESSIEFGKDVATELHTIIRRLHELGINYIDADASLEFKRKYYNDLFKCSPTMTKSVNNVELLEKAMMTSEDFSNRIYCLTEVQKNFVKKIVDECSNTNSYSEFYDKVEKMNKEIACEVPVLQQERLFRVTSVFYYAMKELEVAEKEGVMVLTPHNKFKNVIVKTRSEDTGSFGNACRSFLATAWTIAVGEPTPTGEIVASVLTVLYAGVWLYEVIVCRDTDEEGYCYERFEDCVSPIPDGCSQCLQYCLVNGYWPSYSTHQCS